MAGGDNRDRGGERVAQPLRALIQLLIALGDGIKQRLLLFTSRQAAAADQYIPRPQKGNGAQHRARRAVAIV